MPHQEQALAIPDLRATLTDRSIYRSSPDYDTPSALRIALQAAQTGQKEVFDTSALGGLLKTMKQDTLVDRYLGGLMKGMDNLGRIYFQMLWHREQFEERYGKDDLPELEDSVRNAFEATPLQLRTVHGPRSREKPRTVRPVIATQSIQAVPGPGMLRRVGHRSK